MIVKSKAPVRIDFAGAWTDCAPFANAFGGATLNASINRYVEGQLAIGEGTLGEQKMLVVPGHSKPLPISNKPGLLVNYATDIPAGSGLGTSATLNVVWLSLAKGKPITSQQDKEEIAAAAYHIEKVLGIIGGKQDQYASAVGGINLFEFTEETVRTYPIKLSASEVKDLQSLLVLCYTGKSRLSSNIHENVWGNFRKGRRETVDALFTLRNSAYRGKEILEEGRFDELGELLTLQFEQMKHLDSSTSNRQIEDLFALVAEDLAGGKPCGAGGGGCLLFCCKDARRKAKVTRKIEEKGFAVVKFSLESDGLQVELKR